MKMTHKHDIYFSPHSTEAHSLVMQIADYCNKRGIWYKISESTLGIGIVYGGNVGYVIDADHKTEPQTRTDEDGGVWEYRNGNWWQLGKTESNSEKPNNCEPQMAEDIVRSFGFNVESYRQAKAKDEPQTDCGDFADRLAYERGVKHAWEVAQKVFNSTVTFYEAEDVAKQIDKDINVRSKESE